LVSFAVRDALACAGCRNPSLPVTRGAQSGLEPGSLRFGGTVTGTRIHVVHEAGCADVASCDEVPVQPLYLHDQVLYPVELRLAAEYGFTHLFGIELQLPFRMVKTTIDFATPEGEPYQPLDPDVHHRDETVAGPADPWLLARFGGTVGGFLLAARPGITLPLGNTVEDPFELGDRGIRHQHIQLGSGTFDPVLVLEASRSFGPVDVQAFVQGQAAVYENSHGYRAPTRIYGGTAVGTKLVGKLGGALALDLFHESAEHWDGEVKQDGNLGRTEALAGFQLTQGLDGTTFTLNARFPFYRNIVEGDEDPGTLDSPMILSVGVTSTLPLVEHDHAAHSD
jgi:hypothetical protein